MLKDSKDNGSSFGSGVREQQRLEWPGVTGDEFGRRLDTLESDAVKLLHARWVPGTKDVLDHVVVTPTGVHVIVVSRSKGMPTRSNGAGLFRASAERLDLGGRNRTRLVQRALDQREIVRAAVADESIPVRGVVCLTKADWSRQPLSLTVRGIEVLWLQRLFSQLQADGLLSDERINAVHRRLARQFLAK